MNRNFTAIVCNGVARALVSEVPEYYEGHNIRPSLSALKKVVQVVPKPDALPARFGEDRWDFSSCFTIVREHRNIINFEKAPAEAKVFVKLFALDKLEKGLNVRTVSQDIHELLNILNEAIEASMLKRFAYLDNPDFYAVIEPKEVISYTKCSLYSIVMAFYRSLDFRHIPNYIDQDALIMRRNNLLQRAKYEEVAHAPNIPDDYFDVLITTFDHVMRDNTAPLHLRLTAGIMLMDSQLGLRTSEVLALTKDCVRYTSEQHGSKPYVWYRSIKAARGRNEYKIIETICTPLMLDTYTYYLDLRKQCKLVERSEFLYILPRGFNDITSKEAFRSSYYELVASYVPNARQPHGRIKPVKDRPGHPGEYYIPTVQNFRVHFASYLATCGTPYIFIEKMLSHSPLSKCDGSYYSGVRVPSGPEIEKSMTINLSLEDYDE